jgi:fucose permease
MDNSRNVKVYAVYILVSLLGAVLGRFLGTPLMRYVFMAYLLGLFAFTGALPYLVTRLGKDDKGYVWNAILKFVFPVLALIGSILVVAIVMETV